MGMKMGRFRIRKQRRGAISGNEAGTVANKEAKAVFHKWASLWDGF